MSDTPLAYRPEHRQAATDDLIRVLTETSDISGDVTLPREALNMLLAELRKRDEALARVEALAARWATLAEGDRYYARRLRSAIAAKP